MASKLNPYISFDGNAREAMEFYHGVFGGTLDMTTFGEGGMPHDPSEANNLMHSQLVTDNGMALMGADTPTGMDHQPPSSGMTVSLSGDDDAELTGYWDKLMEGGSVTMPLEQAPWGDKFGMLNDRYGVPWMVNIAGDANRSDAAAS